MKLSTFDAFKKCPHDLNGEHLLTQDQLKKLHGILLEMMDDIVQVCEENGICYTLGGGSVLGALRHKGFIPWDDDIDLNMPRKDYEKFIKVFPGAMGDKYWLHTPQTTPNYALSLSKIRKKGTIMKGRDDFYSEECGVPIDIFVMENTFDNALLRNLHGILCLGMGYLLSCRKFYRDRQQMLTVAKKLEGWKTAFYLKIGIGFLISFLSLDWWCRVTDRCHCLCRNDQSVYVSGCSGRLHYFGELYRRDQLCVPRKAEFHGREWNVPQGAENYLTHCYGNWQQIPKSSEHEQHFMIKFEI